MTSGLSELERVRSELARKDERIDELVRQVELLSAALSEEKRTSEALRQRVSEQIHRSKNMLAILQSIAHRTVRDGRDIPDAREALMGRLRALSRAYHLVTTADGRGIEVAEVVETELAEVIHRVTASGPPARLIAASVQSFALAIHELGSNAAKHGALRSPEGSVAVGWTFFEYGADRFLEVAWTERGGPPPQAPTQHGFGLALVSSFAGSGARTPNVTFETSGLACRLRLSQDVIFAS